MTTGTMPTITTLSPWHERLLKIIADINRRTQEPATLIAIQSSFSYYIAPNTVRYHLKQMEEAALITRQSPKTGYMVVEHDK